MAGYQPDDDWSEPTTATGEPMSGSWRVIAAFAGVLAVVFIVAFFGRFPAGRTLCSVFAVIFLWIAVLSVQALRTGIRDQYFQAGRFGRVYRAESPINYWFYFGLWALMLPLGLAVAIVSAAAVYFNPFAH